MTAMGHGRDQIQYLAIGGSRAQPGKCAVLDSSRSGRRLDRRRIDDVWVDCLEEVRFHSVARGQADGARYCERGRDRAATYQ